MSGTRAVPHNADGGTRYPGRRLAAVTAALVGRVAGGRILRVGVGYKRIEIHRADQYVTYLATGKR
jgi:hypothetical protein